MAICSAVVGPGGFAFVHDEAFDKRFRRTAEGEPTSGAVWLDMAPLRADEALGSMADLPSPVLISGPIAVTPRAARECVAAHQAHAKRRFVVWPHQRLDGIAELRAAVESGAIGELREVSMQGLVRAGESFVGAKENANVYDRTLRGTMDWLAFARSLGLQPSDFENTCDIDLTYYDALRTSFSFEGGKGTLTLLSDADRFAKSVVVLVGTEGRLEWRYDASGAVITQTVGGESVTSRYQQRSDAATNHNALESALAGALGAGSAWSEQAAIHADGIELVDCFLYDKIRSLQHMSSKLHLKTLREDDSPWKDMKSAAAGKETSLLGQEHSTEHFFEPLDKPMRVLLLRIPARKEHMAFSFPSLALAQLSGIARKIGAAVRAFDLLAHFCDDRGNQRLDVSPAEVLAKFHELCPDPGTFDLLGVSVEDPDAFDIIEALCRDLVPRVAPKVVLGGRSSVAVKGRTLTRSGLIDYVVVQEGDLAFLGLLQHLAGRIAENEVPNLWSPRWGETHPTNPVVLPEMDLLPAPSFEDFDLSLYPVQHSGLRAPYLPFLFVVGCQFKCAFCGIDSGRRPRARSGKQVAEQLREMRDRYGVRDFLFMNNLLNVHKRYFREFLDAMIEADLDVRWADSARPEELSTDDLTRMAAAGCVSITFGIDTGSQRLSDFIGKRQNLVHIREVVKAAHAAGIEVLANMIVGMPGETDEDFQEQLDYLESLKGYAAFSFNKYVYTPGSPFYEEPRRYDLLRRGNTFAVRNGLSWREHREKRNERFRILLRRFGGALDEGRSMQSPDAEILEMDPDLPDVGPSAYLIEQSERALATFRSEMGDKGWVGGFEFLESQTYGAELFEGVRSIRGAALTELRQAVYDLVAGPLYESVEAELDTVEAAFGGTIKVTIGEAIAARRHIEAAFEIDLDAALKAVCSLYEAPIVWKLVRVPVLGQLKQRLSDEAQGPRAARMPEWLKAVDELLDEKRREALQQTADATVEYLATLVPSDPEDGEDDDGGEDEASVSGKEPATRRRKEKPKPPPYEAEVTRIIVPRGGGWNMDSDETFHGAHDGLLCYDVSRGQARVLVFGLRSAVSTPLEATDSEDPFDILRATPTPIAPPADMRDAVVVVPTQADRAEGARPAIAATLIARSRRGTWRAFKIRSLRSDSMVIDAIRLPDVELPLSPDQPAAAIA